MTVVTGVASGSSNDFVVTDLSLLADATLSSQSSTGFVLNGADFSITYSGSGFTFSGGAPSGGTITGLSISSTNPYLTSQSWSDLSVSASAAWAAITTGNLSTFDNLFFGGNDTFNSNDTSGMDTFAAFGGSGTFNMQASTSPSGATLEGGSGANTYNFAGNLTSNYHIIGGSVTNTINLDGNTDAALTLVTNIQAINMAAGYSYNLDLDDAAINPAGQTLTIDGSALGASNDMVIAVNAVPILGNLVITGGAGDDTFYAGTGTGNYSFDGGAGSNEVLYSDPYADYTLTHNADGSVTVSKPGGGTDTITHAVYLIFANDYTVPTAANVPWITAITSSPVNGTDLTVGETVTFTVDVSEAVTVVTTGSVPTLSLNDGESASYTSGSGTNTLTFTYTVKSGDSTDDLQVTGLVMQSDGFIESGGVNLYGVNANEDTGIVIDTLTPEAVDARWSPMGPIPDVIGVGSTLTVTIDMNEPVTVNTAGGLPIVTLNDGGTATYVGGSGTSQLAFSYTVQQGNYTTDLQVAGLTIPQGSSITDGAGTNAVVTDYAPFWYDYGNSSLIVDATGPTDFTGDGTSDLLWQNTNGTAAIWMTNGASVTGGDLVGDVGTSWHVAGSGAFFYGNPDADLVWQNDDGTVAIWEMNGTNVVAGSIVADPGSTWHVVGTGDFYGTGYTDLVWQNTNGTVAIWEMNGFQIEGGSIVSDPGPTWHVVGTGDFNGDGKSDLVWQNDDGSVAIWEMNGANPSSGSVIGNPGTSWHVVGVGDFNSDGYADLVWQNTNGTVAIWEMNGLNIVAGAIIADPGASWKVVGVGDYYDNGKSDLLFQNTNGEVAIWEMNGLNAVSGTLLGNPGNGWTLQGNGAAPYTIGSGFTVPLSGTSTALATKQTKGTMPSSAAESFVSLNVRTGIFSSATPAQMAR